MLDLSKISIVSICDSNYIVNTIKAFKYCLKQANFFDSFIITNSHDIPRDNDLNFVYIPHKIDEIGYNSFCINSLHNYIKSDFCLLVQWDGFIIDTTMWDNNFLKYDYIGAPWGFTADCRNRVGNGGFSLRSKYFLEISSTIQYDPYNYDAYTPLQKYDRKVSPEDWYLCYDKFDYLIKNNIKFPTVELASKFSVEHPNIIKQYDRTDLSTYKSFGFHSVLNTGAMKVLEN